MPHFPATMSHFDAPVAELHWTTTTGDPAAIGEAVTARHLEITVGVSVRDAGVRGVKAP
jgi:hypothetical protein